MPFHTDLGCSRCIRSSCDSRSDTGENRTTLPCSDTSVTPYRRAKARNRATSSRFATGSGSGPYRSSSSARTASTASSEPAPASARYASSRSRSPGM